MPFRRRRPSSFATAEPERRGVGAFLKRWTIPIIGALTPVSLIVVNISAFVVIHLTQFRWTISILAFVSGLMLNSWAALNIYRVLKRRRPDHALVTEHNQELVLVGGMGIIVIAAFLTALFCYLGLSSEKDLPNGVTFITGVVAIAVPILLQFLFRRGVRTRRVDRDTTASYSPGLPQSPSSSQLPPPAPPSVSDALRRR
jgi:hypothetical protein